MTSRFKAGSGAYKCRSCGKLTRETGEGESGIELCLACMVESEQENEHDDNHCDPVDGCPYCDVA